MVHLQMDEFKELWRAQQLNLVKMGDSQPEPFRK
jgi:hypothetical protein